MRLALTILFVCVAFVASYPSSRDATNDEDTDDFELELRSILDQLEDQRDNEAQMTRAIDDEDDDDDNDENTDDDQDYFQMSKRQGGHNIIDAQSKCEIACIETERHPARGKGKSVKEAAKVCRNVCKASSKKNVDKKKKGVKAPKRAFIDESDSDDQEQQRRELYEYLKQQYA